MIADNMQNILFNRDFWINKGIWGLIKSIMVRVCGLLWMCHSYVAIIIRRGIINFLEARILSSIVKDNVYSKAIM